MSGRESEDLSCIGPGWHSIARTALKVVEEEGFELAEIKEKFGDLRIYVGTPKRASDTSRQRVYTAVTVAESLSCRTCEECGQPGEKVLVENVWWKTRCHDCGDGRKVR